MENKSAIKTLFPTLVQVSQLADHERLNAGLLRAVAEVKRNVPNSRPASWVGNVYTTIRSQFDLFQLDAFRELHDHAQAEARKFLRALSIDTDHHDLLIHESWVNIYGDGDAQEPHIHANSILSGIYYAKAPADCGAVVFYSPMSDSMIVPPFTQITPANSRLSVLQPSEGQMILFLSSLRHSVQVNPAGRERISISFNAVLEPKA